MKTPNNNISHYILSYLLSVLLLLPLVISCGCGGSYRDDPRLRHIGESLSDPEISEPEALSLLDTLGMIPDKDLSEGERHYRDFLAIKAADKGYVKHTSDSLYLTVKDYFSSRHSRDMLPEVLYYGGRVYSDMGNYPVALQYFQEAMDCTKDDPDRISLRRFAAGQMGRLLSKIRLYTDALPYVEESVRIDKALGDTLLIIYHTELAGHISAALKDYGKARECFEEACRLSKGKYPSEYAFNRFCVGEVTFQQGDLQKAIPIIRQTMNDADSMRRNYVLPVAAQAYLTAGFPDTAFKYATELISNSDSLNKKIGYNLLATSELRGYIPLDTLSEYLSRYAETLRKGMDDNMQEATLIQHSLYNYSLHDRERQKAENERDRLKFRLAVSSAVAVTLALGILFVLLFREKRINKLFRLLMKRNHMKSRSTFGTGPTPRDTTAKDDEEIDERVLTGAFPRGEVLEKARNGLLQSILDAGWDGEELENRMLMLRESEAYQEMFMRLKGGIAIGDDDPIWSQLSDSVESIFPDFLKKLRLLTNGRLSRNEERTAVLVKCGFGVEDIGKAFCRSKSAIVSRRREIARKIFDKKMESKEIIKFIQSL